MKDILIIAHFTQGPNEKGNGRFHYLAQKISEKKVKVEVVTTSFSHRTKLQRSISKELLAGITYNFTMLHEPGYKKNVSLSRFYSHFIFGKKLKKYLKNRQKPDVIYCAVPSLDVAKVATDYAKKNNVRIIVDIQDLWPESFKMVFSIPLISDVIFYPMKKRSDYIYSNADEIIAVSQTYADRALEVNKKCEIAYSIYLGTELAYFDRLSEENRLLDKPVSEIWLVYIGTLGYSYNLYSVIDALKILKDKGIINIKFIVMGDGPLKSKFESYAKTQGISSHFTGRLEYNQMVGILKVCDIAVNPIRSGSAGSIINKVGDYAAAGLPVINTQESKEYKELIVKYKAGFNCKNEDPIDIADKILYLCDENLRKKMGENNRKIAVNYFDRELTYERIYSLLLDSNS